MLAVDEVQLGLTATIDGSQIQAFANALVGILQIIFADQTDVNFLGSILLELEESAPRLHLWC